MYPGQTLYNKILGCFVKRNDRWNKGFPHTRQAFDTRIGAPGGNHAYNVVNARLFTTFSIVFRDIEHVLCLTNSKQPNVSYLFSTLSVRSTFPKTSVSTAVVKAVVLNAR